MVVKWSCAQLGNECRLVQATSDRRLGDGGRADPSAEMVSDPSALPQSVQVPFRGEELTNRHASLYGGKPDADSLKEKAEYGPVLGEANAGQRQVDEIRLAAEELKESVVAHWNLREVQIEREK